MGKCKKCKYWDNEVIGTYTKQFGFCRNGKIKDYNDIETIYDSKTKQPIYDNLNNYHIIYGSDEPVDLETHQDFGCINFKEK